MSTCCFLNCLLLTPALLSKLFLL